MTTVVARGRGKGIVVRTGVETEVSYRYSAVMSPITFLKHMQIGRISKAITSTPNQQTPIQKKLDILGKILVFLAIVLCAVVVGIRIGYKRDSSDTVKYGISLAVSVIPEGLVAVVTGKVFCCVDE
jgi:Ca2+-transporting ATPase